ncbi:Sugar transport protein 1 [Hibiscus syriacus]|uniref:Sugar transport protein 1 n=1 Tax=Hibiscus syriacus TaxID=106335 RepID=A0A6A3AYE4_HIBSY|nr:Sugar transport protein 1 [Hibiscus syriacus]
MTASWINRAFGRRRTMMFGGSLFSFGALLNGLAINLLMLIISRVLLGFGIGFANQSVPIYLSEIAPFKYRGTLNIILGGAIVPGLIFLFGCLFLSDSTNSLLERNKLEEAKDLLRKIRGIENVDEEFKVLAKASEAAKLVQSPWRDIISRKYRPQLTIAILITLFQQLTGMNVFVFYAPVLFKSMGFGNNASLLSSLITSIVKFCATLVSVATVDKYGRRTLFLSGGLQMFICQFPVRYSRCPKYYGRNQHDLHIRHCSSLHGNALQLKFGLLIFFACCVVGMSTFIYKLWPETKGVPIEEMTIVWKNHPYWGKYVEDGKSFPSHETDAKV